VTKSGWINTEIFIECCEKLLKDINFKRTLLKKPDERALLILDGHTTRMNLNLWTKFNNEKVDVLILPSHTSNLLQPLDLCVNGFFKNLLKEVDPFPSKTQMKDKLEIFVREISDRIHDCLSPSAIRKGFWKGKIINEEKDKEKDLNLLENNINEFLKTFPEKCPEKLQVFFNLCIIFFNIEIDSKKKPVDFH
jgi:hypothetical protein